MEIPDESFTVIIGPNACGKSTLLRTLSNLIKPSAGHVQLEGKKLAHTKQRSSTTNLYCSR
ncbi:ATP-binding cassette domain-containing protein [Lysinibacillus sphaericus]|uniref:ATP-binding cassette domain-containing protein n=1 Tax=Lysinibacillus sphaericus TaxID=1421 RepID=UPI003D034E24